MVIYATWVSSTGISTIQFLPCPTKYCCQERNCTTYSSCYKNREGTLCGRCKEGFVQTIHSTECIRRSKCGSIVIWPLIILGGLIYIVCLMYLNEISCVLKKIVSCRRKETITTRTENLASSGAVHVHVNESFVFSGLIEVIFFFAQGEPLIRIDRDDFIENQYINLARTYTSTAANVLNFQLSLSCPFRFITSVMSRILAAGFPFILLVLLGVIAVFFYSIHYFRKVVLKINVNYAAINDFKFKARLMSCLVNTILLTYATVTKTELGFLNCVKVNHAKVLYLDGTIGCYSMWQYILMAFTSVFTFPSHFSLALAASKLKDGRLTVLKFIVHLLLPILSILDTGISCMEAFLKRYRDGSDENNTHQQVEFNQQVPEFSITTEGSGRFYEESLHEKEVSKKLQIIQEESDEELKPCCYIPQTLRKRLKACRLAFQHPSRLNTLGTSHNTCGRNSEIRKAVLTVVSGPYSINQIKYINWEAILIGRRLILILAFTFIPYPTVRMLTFLIFCLTMILHSTFTLPYKSSFVNKSEIISLLVLTIMCIINSIVAFSPESNANLTGCLRTLPKISLNIEAILINIIPVVIFITLLILTGIKLLFILGKLIFRKTQFLLSVFLANSNHNDDHLNLVD